MRRALAVAVLALALGAPAADAAPRADAGAKAGSGGKANPKQAKKAKPKRCKQTKAKGKRTTRRCPKRKQAKRTPAPQRRPDRQPTPGGGTPSGEQGGAPTPTPSGPPSPTGGGSTGGTGSGEDQGAPPALNAVGVKALDRDGVFVFETTRGTVRPGSLTVSFRNEDLDEHDLGLEGTAPLITPVRLSDPIALHRDVTATVTVAVGAYRFFCSVPGHSTMSRALTVAN